MRVDAALSELAAYPVGTIESAVAKLERRPRSEGVSTPGLVAMRRSHAKLFGYAIPVQISVDDGEPHGRRQNIGWWRHIEKQAASPRIVVAQDISSDPTSGVACGRLSAHVYAALGCVGLVTNGFVRDAGSLGDLNFALFASGHSARHGNPHVVRFGAPSDICQVRISPSDVVAIDADGMIAFPAAWLTDVIREARRLEDKQSPIYEHRRSGKATADSLAKLVQQAAQQ
jgi:regulator of RNase E activity RraA